MDKVKGVIGLDIDGTITPHAHVVDKVVEDFFHDLYGRGWIFMFLTGRSFTFAEMVLKPFTFPYLFATQNGASLFEMPEKKLFKKHYLDKSIVAKLQEIFAKHDTDFVMYSGKVDGDFCYVRPDHFPGEHRSHLKLIEELTPIPWVQFETLDDIEQDTFPMLKAMGFYDEMKTIYDEIKDMPEIAVCMIGDPFREKGYYILINHPMATKGNIFNEFTKIMEKKYQKKLITIAAGDDMNDYTMLEMAQIPIAMETGPKELLDIGKIIAKPASENGIIDALTQAIQSHE